MKNKWLWGDNSANI